jgi:hypothetical protein
MVGTQAGGGTLFINKIRDAVAEQGDDGVDDRLSRANSKPWDAFFLVTSPWQINACLVSPVCCTDGVA